MKKINFREVLVYTDIEKTQKLVVDMHVNFANIIYQQGSGIQAHALAMKIYNSKGEEEYTDEECKLIMEYASMCNPFFIDAIKTILEVE